MPNICKCRILYCNEITDCMTHSLKVKRGDTLIIETEHGLEAAKALSESKQYENEAKPENCRQAECVATDEDIEIIENNEKLNVEAFTICQEKIKKHNLPMKLVQAHHFFEKGKIIFFFTSEGRVDFRDLVKDLAAVFKTRIELRQIGIRDEAQLVGGCGVCGREICCHTYKPMTKPVSIKMAKEQNLALNSSKISGLCGRLLCCLTYENDTYRELGKQFPRIGSKVWVGEEKGVVRDVNIQTRKVKIMLDKHKYIQVNCEEIKTNKITGKKAIEDDGE